MFNEPCLNALCETSREICSRRLENSVEKKRIQVISAYEKDIFCVANRESIRANRDEKSRFIRKVSHIIMCRRFFYLSLIMNLFYHDFVIMQNNNKTRYKSYLTNLCFNDTETCTSDQMELYGRLRRL